MELHFLSIKHERNVLCNSYSLYLFMANKQNGVILHEDNTPRPNA